MTIAFVISKPEVAVVQAVQTDPTALPNVQGSLLKFSPAGIPAFLTALQTYAKAHDSRSPEYQATMRLTERLGTYVGQKIVAAKAAAATPAKVATPAPAAPAVEPQNFFKTPQEKPSEVAK